MVSRTAWRLACLAVLAASLILAIRPTTERSGEVSCSNGRYRDDRASSGFGFNVETGESTHLKLEQSRGIGAYSPRGRALAAAWETVRASLPKAETTVFKPDRQLLASFLGTVTSQLKVAVPRFWEESILTMQCFDQDGYVFDILRQDPYRMAKGRSDSARLEGDYWHISKDGEEIRFPASIGSGATDALVVAFSSKVACVAFCSNSGGPYEINAFDKVSEDRLWTAEVWGDGRQIICSGICPHMAEIQLKNDQLFVFGLTSMDAYLEVFDARSGESLCRFSTSGYGSRSVTDAK